MIDVRQFRLDLEARRRAEGKPSPLAYAAQRANETRRSYLISRMGHVMLADPGNRRLMADCGGLERTIRPAKRRPTG